MSVTARSLAPRETATRGSALNLASTAAPGATPTKAAQHMSPRRGVSCGSHSRGTARLSDPGTPVDSVADPDGEPSSSRSAVEIDSGKNIEVNRYTFGDDRAALDRLRRVATAYEPVSRAFLVGHGPRDPQIASTWGAGPASARSSWMSSSIPGRSSESTLRERLSNRPEPGSPAPASRRTTSPPILSPVARPISSTPDFCLPTSQIPSQWPVGGGASCARAVAS